MLTFLSEISAKSPKDLWWVSSVENSSPGDSSNNERRLGAPYEMSSQTDLTRSHLLSDPFSVFFSWPDHENCKPIFKGDQIVFVQICSVDLCLFRVLHEQRKQKRYMRRELQENGSETTLTFLHTQSEL